MSDTIAILLLAAGESARMGRSKQLLTLDGEALLVRAVKTAISLTSNTTVVLGANNEAHSNIIKHLPVTCIVNNHWRNGMGSSLKAGFKHVTTTRPQTEAIIVMACDQPLISTQHLINLTQAHLASTKNIVASHYQHTLGIPVLFAKALFPQILTIDDAQGAKKILTQNHDDVTAVDFQEAAIDLDTEQDYTTFINQHTR